MPASGPSRRRWSVASLEMLSGRSRKEDAREAPAVAGEHLTHSPQDAVLPDQHTTASCSGAPGGIRTPDLLNPMPAGAASLPDFVLSRAARAARLGSISG